MILKRGDWIHLNMPNASGRGDLALELKEQMTKGYAAMGITVAIFSWSSTAVAPTVVAVLKRDE